MALPTFDEALIYKSPTIVTQTRAAVGLDYPVFSGHFRDDFNGAGLPDSTLWFREHPSWGLCNVAAGALEVGTSIAGISGSWVQSRHNLAFPLRRDTDWVFQMRVACNPITGYGAGVQLCGTSFRDAEAVWGIWADTADGLQVRGPLGYLANNVLWSPGADNSVNRYRVTYDHIAQTYTTEIDADDDGTFEIGPFTVAAGGRYVDAITIGNSHAIQGSVGMFSQINVDYVDVVGVAETVEDPVWAAPFTYDGERFTYLPQLRGGRMSTDIDNLVDAAELRLDNFAIDAEIDERRQLYTWMRFMNRRALIEARAGDGNGMWTGWQVMFDGVCAEKDVSLDEGGNCTLVVPIRDRWRAIADDMEINGAYSDAGAPIDGVVMNQTVAQIAADIYANKCGLPATAYNILATPNNTPRNYNVFRKNGQGAVKDLVDMNAMAVWRRRSDSRIEIQEWPWGTGASGYTMTTRQELRSVKWTESAFDVVSGEQLAFENTEYPAGGFTLLWPVFREPFYGRQNHSDSVTCQTSALHGNRPILALQWWARNRKLGSVLARGAGQLWWEVGDEVRIRDDKFLGLDGVYIIDGYEHTWEEDGVMQSQARCINPRFYEFIRQGLP